MKKFKTIIAVCLVAVVSLCCGVFLVACGQPDPTASISGYVNDTKGNVIAGATVKVGDKTATTNEEGMYELTGLPYEALVITASKEGYLDGSESIALEGLAILDEKQNVYGATQNITVMQLGTVTGTIRDNLGNAVSGAKVTVDGIEALTDAQGKYELKGLNLKESTTKAFKAEMAGYYTATANVNFGSSSFERTQNATLAKIGKITVSVFAADGTTPFAGVASVKVGSVSSPKMTTASNNTVEFGEADKISVSSGTVTVSAEGYVDFVAEITAAEFDTSTPPTYTVKAIMQQEYLPGVSMTEFAAAAAEKELTQNIYRMQFFNGTGDDGKVMGFNDTTDIRNTWAISTVGGTSTKQEGVELAGSGDGSETAEFLFTYLFGTMTVTTGENDMMTVSGRRYDNVSAALMGAYVITKNTDGTLSEPVALDVMGAAAGTKTAAINTYYTYVNFDLSAYAGQEIIVVVGNKKSQFNLNMIQFTDKAEAYLDVVDGVKLSTLKSLAPTLGAGPYAQPNRASTGIVSAWATAGRVENGNEGAFCTYGESEHITGNATKLHDFVYGKKDMAGIKKIIIKSRTFMGQVADHKTVGPQLKIVLINFETGAVIDLGSKDGNVDTDTDFPFDISEDLTGDYLVLIGSMNGYHAAISSITFSAV